MLFSQKETKGLQMQYATSYKTSGDAMAHVGDAPDVGALNEELRRAATDLV